jgi:hypothetical protein
VERVPGRPVATVTFASNQAAGAGPRERPNETCTRWRVTYQLTARVSGDYLVYRGAGVSDPC